MSNKSSITGHTFVIPADNIDTDQIYPARFLTTTGSEGLGTFCFRDWRDNPQSRFHALFNAFEKQHHVVLVAGANFGSGSSREHAVWSLLDMGFKAVVSTRFGEIFRNNALNNGLVPVQVGAEVASHLLENTDLSVRIDLEKPAIAIEGLGSFEFELDRFAARCIIEGKDSVEFLLDQSELIAEYEAGHQVTD